RGGESKGLMPSAPSTQFTNTPAYFCTRGKPPGRPAAGHGPTAQDNGRSEGPRVFISCAHRDGGNLALRLQRDLEARGFDVWLDRLKGGDLWTNQVVRSTPADVVLALLCEWILR